LNAPDPCGNDPKGICAGNGGTHHQVECIALLRAVQHHGADAAFAMNEHRRFAHSRALGKAMKSAERLPLNAA